jgi:hypothetical protein
MQRHNQTVFSLERLQPDWLPGSQLLRAYHRWAILLPGVLIGVLVSLAIPGGLGNIMVTALVGGLLGGLLSGGGAAQPPEPHGRKMKYISWQQFLQWLAIGSLIGLGSGLSNGLSSGVIGGLCDGVIYGLGSLLLQVLLVKSNPVQPPSQTSPPIGRTKWQRLIMNTALRNGLLIGVVVGLSFGLSSWLSYGLAIGLSFGLRKGLSFGLLDGLSGGLSFGFIGGLTPAALS